MERSSSHDAQDGMHPLLVRNDIPNLFRSCYLVEPTADIIYTKKKARQGRQPPCEAMQASPSSLRIRRGLLVHIAPYENLEARTKQGCMFHTHPVSKGINGLFFGFWNFRASRAVPDFCFVWHPFWYVFPLHCMPVL